jgi:outer membrane protein OmpA-like peptidoglycan-associated protein
MKGVPSSSVSIADKAVRFNAGNEADVAKLIEGAKGILPADFTVEAEPQLDVAAAVAGSINSAKQAISGLGDNASADDLVRALNLQIINFATDSSEIPAENQEILDLAAAKLSALPEATLKIIGHTDNQASHEYNQQLSEKRATAVRDYLVSKGVPAERLSVQGASYDHPVASNATEQGRFQNRRIEFTLSQAGEQVAAVGNAPTSEATQVEANQAEVAQPVEAPAATESK